ncbi:MAG: RNA-binding transcriptional accessory protein [Deferribacteraceae bacterium]|jgi:uncharacterized protein|nr:RNA-binding transcriptional accessory protein [Deferribacteraceae bacterium]
MINRLSSEFPFKPRFIENLINMSDEGNTVPFIARYRKEQTGAMDEIQIREVLERCEYLRNLEKRKAEVIALIDERGKLTPELKLSILNADTLSLVEDLYAPYKSKKKTKADIAREAGLQPLADFICISKELTTLYDEAKKYITDTVTDADTAINMARDIIIEQIGHNLEVKQRIRELYQANAVLSSKSAKESKERTAYEDYYDFAEKVSTIPPHRVMAIFRGEREEILKVEMEMDEELCINACATIAQNSGVELNQQTEKAINRAVKVMLMPSVELEVRGALKDTGEERAIEVFANNLKSLIMTPPVKNRVVLGLDPAFRTGCKFAVVDDTGLLLDYGVIYPTAPHNDYDGSKRTLQALIKKDKINAIAIGNGTASRETEEFVAQMIADIGVEVPYTIVNEAGASVYSASEVAAKEFPELDVTIRGAISIARRVIDPLAELVKIEPRSIGVGMYQHDVNKKKLEQSLNAVVEDVVNSVGVNLNTASVSLLGYVSGLNNSLANKIVQFREKAGRFSCREELLKIAGIGEAIYRQCAGFLKVYDGKEPLDKMFIHPESYEATHNLLNQYKLPAEHAALVRKMIKKSLPELAKDLGVGEYTLKDIIDNLERPDRDIRDTVDPVIFKKDVVNLESLSVGMILDGKITNVVDFGAFVDIGLKNDGLVHISALADKFVKTPKDVVSVGQRVKVKVLSIDKERGRVGLSMKL